MVMFTIYEYNIVMRSAAWYLILCIYGSDGEGTPAATGCAKAGLTNARFRSTPKAT
jgi:hypothetical protein